MQLPMLAVRKLALPIFRRRLQLCHHETIARFWVVESQKGVSFDHAALTLQTTDAAGFWWVVNGDLWPKSNVTHFKRHRTHLVKGCTHYISIFVRLIVPVACIHSSMNRCDAVQQLQGGPKKTGPLYIFPNI